MTGRSLHYSLALLALLCGPAVAQTDAPADTAEAEVASLLTAAELQTLVAPVALYPDTLLIQVLVGATYPLDVAKAQILLGAVPKKKLAAGLTQGGDTAG